MSRDGWAALPRGATGFDIVVKSYTQYKLHVSYKYNRVMFFQLMKNGGLIPIKLEENLKFLKIINLTYYFMFSLK